MAKDKSKKPDKGGKKPKGDSDFGKPSEATGGGDGWTFEDESNLGSLFLITPLRAEHKPSKFNDGETKEVIVCDIVELNEKKPEKSELHEDAWVFGGYTRGSLRSFIGEKRVVGRLSQGKKDRGNIPWTLDDPTERDLDIARAYIDSVDPFDQPGGGKKGKKKK